MRLSQELLAEIVTAIRHDRRLGVGDERRAYPRMRVWAPRRVVPLAAGDAPGTPHRIWMRDLSRGGVGFMYQRPLALGAEFLIPMPVLAGEPHWFVCRVVYCAGSPEEMYSIGTSFVQRWDRAGGKRLPPPEEA